MKLHIGDQVLVTAGKDKGKKGKITRVLPTEAKVVVAGANMYVKHVKKQGEREGQRVVRERPMPSANVAIIDPDTGKRDRVGYRIEKDGSKVRVFKKSGKVVKEV